MPTIVLVEDDAALSELIAAIWNVMAIKSA